MRQIIDIDIRGQICPSCLLVTLRTVNRHTAAIKTGAVEVCVTTDDRQATATIPATVGRMGLRCEVASHDAAYRIRVFGGTGGT